MSLIIAARFETFEQAQNAAGALMKNGVTSEDMHTFFVNPAGAHARFPIGGDRVADPDAKGAPGGAAGFAVGLAVVGAIVGALIGFSFGHTILPVVGGAGLGAYIGSLIGGLSRMGRGRSGKTTDERHEADAYGGRAAGVLLAVRVDRGHERTIGDILRQHGGIEIERAQGRWQDGQWKDFDPLTTPDLERPEDAGARGPASSVQ